MKDNKVEVITLRSHMQIILFAHFCIFRNHSQSQRHNHILTKPRVFVCVSRSLVSHSLPHISLFSLPLSVAAVLVMAVCPWCKLAVGSQVAHMTVIDVQVFNSSHTETPEQRTRTHAEAQYACMHSIVVHMQVVMYLHNYAYKLYISLSPPRKLNDEKKKKTRTTESLCIQLLGLSGVQQQ